MKGRMTRRFGGAMKTKMVGGVSTKHHDNPHVMKRASGGRCAEAGGAVAAPSLSRPMRRMGGKVGFKDQGSKNQGEMPKASSASDVSRVEKGMDGKEQNRAYGGVVQPKTFPGHPGKKAGPAASGGRGLKSPGSQSGTVKTAGMGSQSKNEGEVGSTKKDGTKNASGKTFASGGKVEKDEDGDDEEDDSSDDAADEDEALDKVEHEAEHHASGGKVKGFNPGGERGKLHRELGISEDKKIPAKRLAKAERSKDPEIARDAKRAETMKHWKH